MLCNRSTLLKQKKDINYYYFHYYVHDALMTMCLQAGMPTATYGPSAAVPMQIVLPYGPIVIVLLLGFLQRWLGKQSTHGRRVGDLGGSTTVN